MILVDTSAWVEFLRNTGSAVCQQVRELLGDELATCDPVRMEVMFGARDDAHLRQLQGLLARAVTLDVRSWHYDDAATLYRSSRRKGETVRKPIDCLIAAVAIEAAVPILHADSDYELLARHAPLLLA